VAILIAIPMRLMRLLHAWLSKLDPPRPLSHQEGDKQIALDNRPVP
jgi:hypothetical protein